MMILIGGIVAAIALVILFVWLDRRARRIYEESKHW